MTEGEDGRKPISYYIGGLLGMVVSALVFYGMHCLYPGDPLRMIVYSVMVLLAVVCFVKALTTLLEKPEEEEEDDDEGL